MCREADAADRRIRRDAHHYRRGTDWKIFPFYDFAHGLSDAIEGITHSLCTLEFENNRAIYDWLERELPVDLALLQAGASVKGE